MYLMYFYRILENPEFVKCPTPGDHSVNKILFPPPLSQLGEQNPLSPTPLPTGGVGRHIDRCITVVCCTYYNLPPGVALQSFPCDGRRRFSINSGTTSLSLVDVFTSSLMSSRDRAAFSPAAIHCQL